jgi:hypothetical protein
MHLVKLLFTVLQLKMIFIKATDQKDMLQLKVIFYSADLKYSTLHSQYFKYFYNFWILM